MTQNAYMPGRSTTKALYTTVSQITEALNNQQKVTGVFLDLSKAFDSVDHVNLLNKLELMGFRGIVLKLLKSYLMNRYQRVIADHPITGEQLTSEWELVKTGVPQGSLIGSFLYILYVNDLHCQLPYELGMYADDTSVIIKTESDSTMANEISNSMRCLSNWFQENNLKLNVEKTKIIKFSLRAEKEIEINYNNSVLTSADNAKFLGVVLDGQLRWKAHIDDLCSRMSAFTYALRTISMMISPEAGLTSYYAYVYSRIRYAIQVWGNAVEASRVFRLQKSALRSIYGLKQRETCKTLFKEKQILTFPSIYVCECAMLAKKHYREIFSCYETNHTHDTRTNRERKLKIPQTVSASLHRGAVTQTLKIYNHLPTSVKILPYVQFKKRVVGHLLKHGFYSVSEYFQCEDFGS